MDGGEPVTGLRRRIMNMERKELEDLLLRSQDEIITLKKCIREHEESEKKLAAKLQRANSKISRPGGEEDGNTNIINNG